MLYTLDTNVVSAIITGRQTVLGRVAQVLQDDHVITLNAICYYETLRGLLHVKHRRKYRLFETLVEEHHTLPLDIGVLDEAAQIYHQLREQGRLIEDADILVAAIARFYQAILVTRNIKHFARIERLNIENWEADAS